MQFLKIKPTIYVYQKTKEFAEAYRIGKKDLILTNEVLYKNYMESLGLQCAVIFQEAYGTGEPSDQMAEAIWADIPKDTERIFAVGGGTILDLGKLFALETVSPVVDLYDGKIPPVKKRKLILVPTTCGTGSEMTNIFILALTARNTKKGLATEELYADDAVLIPELLEKLPFEVFATSSIDALIHGIESSLSPKGNQVTRMFGYHAIEQILRGYMKIRDCGRGVCMLLTEDFLVASCCAGIAFGNAGCAAVHALSYPLGAKYHVPHGEANYAVFDGVMKQYMAIRQDGEMDRLNRFMAGILGCGKEEVYRELRKLLDVILPRKPLREYGVTPEDLEEFTESVMTEQGRLMANNFTELSRDMVYDIYRKLY